MHAHTTASYLLGAVVVAASAHIFCFARKVRNSQVLFLLCLSQLPWILDPIIVQTCNAHIITDRGWGKTARNFDDIKVFPFDDVRFSMVWKVDPWENPVKSRREAWVFVLLIPSAVLAIAFIPAHPCQFVGCIIIRDENTEQQQYFSVPYPAAQSSRHFFHAN